MSSDASYTLPKLDYAYDALEPQISKQIMEIHHSKHHQTYVNNLNAAITSYKTADLRAQIHLQQAIKFNGGGHVNHTIFFANLAPVSSGKTKIPSADSALGKAVAAKWGSVDNLVKEFNALAATLQGSGWVWLVKNKSTNELALRLTSNQDPVTGPEVPIIGVDMWEHAYYLQYYNNKAEYLKNIWGCCQLADRS